MPVSSFPTLAPPQLCTHTPLGSSELFWASTSSAFHIRLCVNYDASVKTSLLTVSGMENGKRNKGNSNYRLLALINAHLLCLVFQTQSPHYWGEGLDSLCGTGTNNIKPVTCWSPWNMIFQAKKQFICNNQEEHITLRFSF